MALFVDALSQCIVENIFTNKIAIFTEYNYNVEIHDKL